jgi:hypothetical protein
MAAIILAWVVVVLLLLGLALWLPGIRLRRRTAETPRPTAQSAEAVIVELRSTLALREVTIKELREKGRRAVADRDRWEATAKKLQLEIADLKTGRMRSGRTTGDDSRKFRELKAALAKMFHPDALRSASNFERVVREELFKEINIEIDRIDGKGPKP